MYKYYLKIQGQLNITKKINMYILHTIVISYFLIGNNIFVETLIEMKIYREANCFHNYLYFT